MIINRFRIKIIINVFLFNLVKFLYHWLQQIQTVFYKPKKLLKLRNLKRGISWQVLDSYVFSTWVPITRDFDSWSLPHQELLALNSRKGIRQAISQIAQFPGILAMPPLDKDSDRCTQHQSMVQNS